MRQLIKGVSNTLLRPFGLVLTTHRALHPGLSWELDEAFHERFERAHSATDTAVNDLRRQRHYVLMQLFQWSLRRTETPRVAECGVFKGASLHQLASILQGRGELHAVDSFAGLQAIQSEDGPIDERRGDFLGTLSMVQKNLSEFPWIHYHRVEFPRVPTDLPANGFTFVHIDLDLYAPIASAFRLFLPRLVPGAIIVFDDYGYVRDFPGAKKAIDEVCAEAGLFPVVLPTGQAFVRA